MIRHALARVDKWIGILEMLFCVAFLGLIVIVTGGGVILRYVFDAPLTWGSDTSLLAMIWLAFVGSGAVYRRGGHLSASSLPDALGGVAGGALRSAVSLAVIGCAFVMGWFGVKTALIQHSQDISSLGIPRSLYSLPIVWAAASLAFASLADLARHRGAGSGGTPTQQPDGRA